MPDISHVIVCGVKTTETSSSGTTTTAPGTTTTAAGTTTTAAGTTTTPPTTTTTTDVEVSGTRTTAPASTTTTTAAAAGTTTTPAAVLGVKITGGRSDVVASRQAARQLAYTGSQTWLAAGTSAVLLLAGVALIVASGSFRRPNRKH